MPSFLSESCPQRALTVPSIRKGERRIWIEAAVVDRLTAMRRRSESMSDVILRLAEIEGRAATP
jgi:hypothetical protein